MLVDVIETDEEEVHSSYENFYELQCQLKVVLKIPREKNVAQVS